MRATNHRFRVRAVAGVRGGFTLVETIIVLGIIALLVGVLLLAIGHVKKKADVVSEQATVTTLQKAVEKYRQDFGALPPLVVDVANWVNPTTGDISIWSDADLADPNTTLNGSTPPTDRRCYSEYTLPYYLVGALSKKYDGIDGIGFTAPNASGQFTRKGRKFEPLLDLTNQKTRSGIPRLFIDSADPTNCRILDRWCVSATGPDAKYIRYYRWENEYWSDPARGLPNPAPSADLVGKVKAYHVPLILGDPATKPELRDAAYAIVSSGPDHKFGDESGTLVVSETYDNVVEVGK